MTDRLEYLRQFGIVRIVDLGQVQSHLTPGIWRERFEFADGRSIEVDCDIDPHSRVGVALARHMRSDAVLSEALGVEVRGAFA